ncbi:hypothetical protein [Brevibacillus sp. AY1]|uniref:hypothetical protein n=1 Tax=Brevibacillus sp. AY1 TaxID=2807621 RepID=UPI002458B396|nr:hypothetical protein [Brevibacillus sp. AY1]MDH4616233.1 hypothetical protein [Brevibacillus sp. AY1]
MDAVSFFSWSRAVNLLCRQPKKLKRFLLFPAHHNVWINVSFIHFSRQKAPPEVHPTVLALSL